MTDNIIYQGKTKKGNLITIRYPNSDDAPLLQEFINKVSLEQTFIRFQGEQQTLEDESKWLNGQLELIQKNKAVMLVVEHQNKIIGSTTLDMRTLVENHIGLFGIVLAEDFRNEGIGKLLMSNIFEQAEKTIPELKIIELSVFANNPIAISIYKNFGFVEYGTLPKGILHKGEYIDHIYMFKKIR